MATVCLPLKVLVGTEENQCIIGVFSANLFISRTTTANFYIIRFSLCILLIGIFFVQIGVWRFATSLISSWDAPSCVWPHSKRPIIRLRKKPSMCPLNYISSFTEISGLQLWLRYRNDYLYTLNQLLFSLWHTFSSICWFTLSWNTSTLLQNRCVILFHTRNFCLVHLFSVNLKYPFLIKEFECPLNYAMNHFEGYMLFCINAIRAFLSLNSNYENKL